MMPAARDSAMNPRRRGRRAGGGSAGSTGRERRVDQAGAEDQLSDRGGIGAVGSLAPYRSVSTADGGSTSKSFWVTVAVCRIED
jgi:hypothetical protein